LIKKGVALMKRCEDKDEKSDALTLLIDLHEEAADDRATLACFYTFGKKAGKVALRQLDLDGSLAMDESKQSLHYMMTKRKLDGAPEKTLPI